MADPADAMVQINIGTSERKLCLILDVGIIVSPNFDMFSGNDLNLIIDLRNFLHQ